MDKLKIFSAAIGITLPWEIEEISFKDEEDGTKTLHIYLGHKRGIKFMYEGQECQLHDHLPRVWRHLDFFEHTCYLHAGVPRIRTKDGQVKTVEVPWADKGSSFTLLFEQKVLELVKNGMNATKSGKTMRIGSKVVFRICKKTVINAIAEQPVEKVKNAGLDETSYKKGHKYLTVLTDRERKKVVGIGYGKDAKALEESLYEMEIRGGDRASVRSITMDMSPAYISGVNSFMPKAAIVFDRFHLMLNLNKGIDQIRKKEQKKFSDLKKTKFIWLRNHNTLSEENAQLVSFLSDKYQDLGRAYQLKEQFRELLDNAKEDSRLKWLNAWMKLAWSTGIKELQGFVKMLRSHWYGIKTYFKYLSTNAYAERVNLTIQEIKRVAKGYRNIENFKFMIYLHLGGLNFSIPH